MFHRMINTFDDSGPISSRFAKNGDPYTSFAFYDFNSLYLWCQGEKLPVGPGIMWEKYESKFNKRLLASQTSFVAMQWLLYVEEYSPFLINDDGTRSKLETYHYRGEKDLFGYKVDGYAEVIKNGMKMKIFLEFDGCRLVIKT